MAVNPYIRGTGVTSEGNLVNSLIVESIKIHGDDVVYIPRTLLHEDLIIGEDRISQFDSAHTIEMYNETFDRHDGDGDIIMELGLQVRDVIILTVAKSRFSEVVASIFPDIQRPKEGDLIYYPISKTLFEIKFVEHEHPYYQLGKQFVFKITAELFTYNQEEMETGNPELDSLETDLQNNLDETKDAYASNIAIENEADGNATDDYDDSVGDVEGGIVDFNESDRISKNKY